MSKSRSTLPNPVESDANLASALEQIGTEVDNQPLRSSALARIMRETFHRSDAGGAWDWRMAYDLMQAAAIQVVLRGDGAAGDIAAAICGAGLAGGGDPQGRDRAGALGWHRPWLLSPAPPARGFRRRGHRP